jgi:hypothetical protein
MCMLIAKFSSQAHELVLPFLMGTSSSLVLLGHCEVLPQPVEAQRSPDPGIMPEGPGEGTFALGECETFGRGVQMRPATRRGAVRVGYDEPGTSLVLRVRPCDHPQQLTLGGSRPASDAGPDRSVAAGRDVEL